MQVNWVRLALSMSGGFFVAMALTGAWHAPAGCLTCWGLRLALGSLAFGTVMSLAFRFVLLPINVGRLHRQNPTLYRDIELIADAGGVSIKGPRSTANFPWPEFRGFKENARVFLISKSKSVFFTIPKRGLPADVVAAFRDVLGQRLTRLR